jgi:ligand-binding sensor domain-containing protein
MSWPPRTLTGVLVGGLLAAAPLEGLEADRAVTQFVLESWIVKDGAPAGAITGITQTPNGYLWLGTEAEGLVRFDGVRFAHEEGLDRLFGRRVEIVTSLMSSRSGALWIGTTHGLARFQDGRWTAFDEGEAHHVFGLHEAPDGAVWYARHWDGAYRVRGGTVTSLPLSGKPRFVTSDTRGAVWIGGYEGLWRLSGEDRQFYIARDGLPDTNVTQVLGEPGGDVWLGFQVGLVRMRDGEVVETFTTRDGLSNDEISAIYTDRGGTLWVGTVNGGLNRRRGGRFESLTKARGLTSNRVTAIYEDREGGLWVGTAGGLNRLRDASLVPVGEPEGLSPREPLSVVEGGDGSVLVASGFGGLNRIKDGRVESLPAASVPGSDFDGALFVDSDGGVWSGHRNGLSYRRNGKGVLYPATGVVTALAGDARSLVFASDNGAIFRLLNGKAERYRLADGSLLGPESLRFDYVWGLRVSSDGTLWLATTRGVFAVRDGRAREVWSQGTLSARSIFEDEQGAIWLGTMAGVVRVAGGSLARFTTEHGLPEQDIHHVLSDGRGALWMGGAGGIFRVQRRELEDVAAGRAAVFRAERFGVLDGMRSSVAIATYQPASCATRDGRLWFATTEGVVAVDPKRIRRNALPPPVVVESVVADSTPLTAEEPRVPAGTERLAIHYNGLSLLIPLRVRFKYQLEGYDRGWVDAAGRRVAYYTKLPPGDYTFKVTAANNDGVWNPVGAGVRIRQLPYFHQTWWFLLAVGLAAASGIVASYRLRVRRHRRVERQLQASVAEALARIRTLSGLLPICAWCKKVRDDTGYWSQIETYVRQHSEADFSHGICPECNDKVRAGLLKQRPEPER